MLCLEKLLSNFFSEIHHDHMEKRRRGRLGTGLGTGKGIGKELGQGVRNWKNSDLDANRVRNWKNTVIWTPTELGTGKTQ